MACGKWISTAVTLVLFLGAFTGVTVWTGHVEALRYKEKPKKHFLAWESRKRPEEYRHLKQYIRSNRRFDFSRERVISLTKSSFWNKRPYQFSTPVMSGSIIYVGADAGYFYAVDMRLKKKLWAYKTEGAIETSAAFDDEAVFFGDSKAVFYSLNAKTGKLNWKTVLDTSVMAAPLLLNDRIFVVTMSGRLFAIDRASGVEIWHTESHERDFGFTVRRASSPVFVNGNIYLGTSSGLIMAFDVRDGSIAWARQIGDRRNQLYDVDSKPLVVGDMLYVSSADGNLACIDPLSGKILWEISAGGASDPILHEGKIYSTEGDTLSCIDPDTGDMLWKQEFDDSGLSSPAGGRHFVTVASTTDRLYLVDSDTGDIMHERYIRKGSFGDPLVIDDTIYVLSNSGRIFTFKIREISSKKKRLVAKTMK